MQCVKQALLMARSRGLLLTPSLRAVLQLIQQLTGINTVMYYCGTIFTLAGFTDPNLAIWLTAAVSFVGWICCFGGVLAVERAGRRKLTLASLAGVVVALVALGGGFFYSECTSPHALPHGPAAGANNTGGSGGCQAYRSCFDCVVDSGCGFCGPAGGGSGYCVAGNATGPSAGAAAATCASLAGHVWSPQSCPGGNLGGHISLVATAAYLAAFQPGMGTMPWTVNSEIYPLRARSLGISLATMTNWVSNLLISYTFLDLTVWVTTPGAFWIYAGIGAPTNHEPCSRPSRTRPPCLRAAVPS